MSSKDPWAARGLGLASNTGKTCPSFSLFSPRRFLEAPTMLLHPASLLSITASAAAAASFALSRGRAAVRATGISRLAAGLRTRFCPSGNSNPAASVPRFRPPVMNRSCCPSGLRSGFLALPCPSSTSPRAGRPHTPGFA
ncbi:hypothetical protein C8R44DRAFT_886454 [Mycena epipterygia]|nr:hypothetical protein C8R44DRAFT_886454 [Mycena epipterygia]